MNSYEINSFFQSDASYKCTLTIDGSMKTTEATWISKTQLTCSPMEVCIDFIITHL